MIKRDKYHYKYAAVETIPSPRLDENGNQIHWNEHPMASVKLYSWKNIQHVHYNNTPPIYILRFRIPDDMQLHRQTVTNLRNRKITFWRTDDQRKIKDLNPDFMMNIDGVWKIRNEYRYLSYKERKDKTSKDGFVLMMRENTKGIHSITTHATMQQYLKQIELQTLLQKEDDIIEMTNPTFPGRNIAKWQKLAKQKAIHEYESRYPKSNLPERISKEQIKAGLTNRTIRIQIRDDMLAAKIGQYWFYIGKAKHCKRKHFADLIYEAINSEPINHTDKDQASECLYYKAILEGNRHD